MRLQRLFVESRMAQCTLEPAFPSYRTLLLPSYEIFLETPVSCREWYILPLKVRIAFYLLKLSLIFAEWWRLSLKLSALTLGRSTTFLHPIPPICIFQFMKRLYRTWMNTVSRKWASFIISFLSTLTTGTHSLVSKRNMPSLSIIKS